MEQLTIGQVIDALEEMDLMYDKKEQKEVDFDFGSAIPTTIDSWRGVYYMAALGYELSGYDNNENHFNKTGAKDLLAELKGSIESGRTYQGWKGGEYSYDRDTELWVANSGNSGNTGIIEVMDDGYRIVLKTGYFEV